MKNIWAKYKGWVFLIIILIGIINVNWFFNKNSISQEEFFNNAVTTSYRESYEGVVIDKYHEKRGDREMIVIENNGTKRIFDYVYEKRDLFNFIKINDTLIKKGNTNRIQVKRNNFDTIIPLKFEKIKGFNIYSKNNNLIEQ